MLTLEPRLNYKQSGLLDWSAYCQLSILQNLYVNGMQEWWKMKEAFVPVIVLRVDPKFWKNEIT